MANPNSFTQTNPFKQQLNNQASSAFNQVKSVANSGIILTQEGLQSSAGVPSRLVGAYSNRGGNSSSSQSNQQTSSAFNNASADDIGSNANQSVVSTSSVIAPSQSYTPDTAYVKLDKTLGGFLPFGITREQYLDQMNREGSSMLMAVDKKTGLTGQELRDRGLVVNTNTFSLTDHKFVFRNGLWVDTTTGQIASDYVQRYGNAKTPSTSESSSAFNPPVDYTLPVQHNQGTIINPLPRMPNENYNFNIENAYAKALKDSGVPVVKGIGDNVKGISGNDFTIGGSYYPDKQEIYVNEMTNNILTHDILGSYSQHQVVAHEFGHYLDDTRNINNDIFMESTPYKVPIGKYGYTDSSVPKENFANSFRLFIDNPTSFREKYPQQASVFETELGYSKVTLASTDIPKTNFTSNAVDKAIANGTAYNSMASPFSKSSSLNPAPSQGSSQVNPLNPNVNSGVILTANGLQSSAGTILNRGSSGRMGGYSYVDTKTGRGYEISSSGVFTDVTPVSKMTVSRSGAINVDGIDYIGNSVVPDTGGLTANQINQSLMQQYNLQAGRYYGQINVDITPRDSGLKNYYGDFKMPEPSYGYTGTATQQVFSAGTFVQSAGGDIKVIQDVGSPRLATEAELLELKNEGKIALLNGKYVFLNTGIADSNFQIGQSKVSASKQFGTISDYTKENNDVDRLGVYSTPNPQTGLYSGEVSAVNPYSTPNPQTGLYGGEVSAVTPLDITLAIGAGTAASRLNFGNLLPTTAKGYAIIGDVLLSSEIVHSQNSIVNVLQEPANTGFDITGIPEQAIRVGAYAVTLPYTGAAYATEFAKGLLRDTAGTLQGTIDYTLKNPYEVFGLTAAGVYSKYFEPYTKEMQLESPLKRNPVVNLAVVDELGNIKMKYWQYDVNPVPVIDVTNAFREGTGLPPISRTVLEPETIIFESPVLSSVTKGFTGYEFFKDRAFNTAVGIKGITIPTEDLYPRYLFDEQGRYLKSEYESKILSSRYGRVSSPYKDILQIKSPFIEDATGFIEGDKSFIYTKLEKPYKNFSVDKAETFSKTYLDNSRYKSIRSITVFKSGEELGETTRIKYLGKSNLGLTDDEILNDMIRTIQIRPFPEVEENVFIEKERLSPVEYARKLVEKGKLREIDFRAKLPKKTNGLYYPKINVIEIREGLLREAINFYKRDIPKNSEGLSQKEINEMAFDLGEKRFSRTVAHELVHAKQPKILFRIEDKLKIPYRYQPSEVLAYGKSWGLVEKGFKNPDVGKIGGEIVFKDVSSTKNILDEGVLSEGVKESLTGKRIKVSKTVTSFSKTFPDERISNTQQIEKQILQLPKVPSPIRTLKIKTKTEPVELPSMVGGQGLRTAPLYAGSNMYETYQSTSYNGNLAALNNSFKSDLLSKQNNFLFEGEIPKQVSLPKQVEIFKETQQPKQVEIPKQVELQKEVQLSKQDSALQQNMSYGDFIIGRETIQGRGEIISKRDERKRKVKIRQVPTYNVLLRKHGKFQPIAYGLPKEEALRFGSNKALRDIARTFRITPTGKTTELFTGFNENPYVPNPNQFRGYKVRGGKIISTPDQFVQRTSANLQSYEEKSQIADAKRLSKIMKNNSSFLA